MHQQQNNEATSPAVALFQKVHGKMVMLQRLDAQLAGLIEQRIYPAVLWQLDEIPGHRERFADECALADRLLALHCDGRYSAADMQRVAACVASLSACG